MSTNTPKANSKEALERLTIEVEMLIAPVGYEVVAIEQTLNQGRRLVVYIDFRNNNDDGTKRIGLEDCVRVNELVDELFENTPLLEGAYTLEVSSPGVERPLRKPADYARFKGKKAKLHTFRPLDKEEAGNDGYWEKNKKQKNFVGMLEGLSDDKVAIKIDGQVVRVPLALISKAHLEIDFKVNKESKE